MIGRMLASLGIGSAKVDTKLAKSTYRQGEQVTGDILVQGGKTTQKIDSIYLYLMLQPLLDDQQEEHLLDEFLLTESFAVAASETKVIPFQFQLPDNTPVTIGGASIYLKTGLDVKHAVDPDDHDGIEVQPHRLVENVIQTMKQFGYYQSDVYFDHGAYHDTLPFAQKYRLQSSSNQNSLSFGFQIYGHEMRVVVQRIGDSSRIARFSLQANECEQRESLHTKLEQQLTKHFNL